MAKALIQIVVVAAARAISGANEAVAAVTEAACGATKAFSGATKAVIAAAIEAVTTSPINIVDQPQFAHRTLLLPLEPMIKAKAMKSMHALVEDLYGIVFFKIFMADCTCLTVPYLPSFFNITKNFGCVLTRHIVFLFECFFLFF